jgi:catechol 2,3-dioxygenase-like lactoylglutathione lyase family enzyme
MDISIYQTMLPHDDPDASLAFYRDTLGFEVRNDVEYGGMHWITVGPPDQPGTSIVLYPPAADPGITDDERRTIAEMMAKGSYASIILVTATDGTVKGWDEISHPFRLVPPVSHQARFPNHWMASPEPRGRRTHVGRRMRSLVPAVPRLTAPDVAQ